MTTRMLDDLPVFEVGERVIVPVHTDDKYHNATVIAWEQWANDRQREKYVRAVTEEGRKVTVLRREVVKEGVLSP